MSYEACLESINNLMRINIPILFILFIAFLSCQTEPRRISLAELKGYYNDLYSFSRKFAERTPNSFVEVKLPTDHPFYTFVKKYPLYFEYLLWNYTNKQLFKRLIEEKDSVQFNIKFVEILKTDSIFNAGFLPIAHAYLKSKHILVTDYSPPPVPVLTEKEFFLTASRFFYADTIDSFKRIEWKICVGTNPYRTDSSLRKYPAVEAFCFAAMLNSTSFEYYSDFDRNTKMIEPETISLADSTILIYARKRMIEEMMKSKHLQKLLIKKYKAGKNELAFIVK
jgi:hypothetical protein